MSHRLGGRDDPINDTGLEYYSNLVDALLDAGIVPYVTLFHWDLPSALEKRYGGWSNSDEITKDFERFARVIFAHLGDRVKHWITLNEVGEICGNPRNRVDDRLCD
jgi:beta-glucosidase